MIWLVKQFLLVRRAVCAKDSARQMAFGFACGMLLGLLPKGNLLAVAVGAAIFATRVSLPVCMLAALAFSLVSGLLDPLTGRIGQSVLTYAPLVPLWERWNQLPMAPWTAFNNTVVMGNLILGTGLFYPTYRLALPWVTRYRQLVLSREATKAGVRDSDAEAAGLRELPEPVDPLSEPMAEAPFTWHTQIVDTVEILSDERLVLDADAQVPPIPASLRATVDEQRRRSA